MSPCKPVLRMAVGCWCDPGAEPVILTCCGGHTSRSGGPGSPGTARSFHTARSSPLAPVSPARNRRGVKADNRLSVLPLCPRLDSARDRIHPGPWFLPHQRYPYSGREQAEPPPSPTPLRRGTFAGNTSTPGRFSPQPTAPLQGCRSRLCQLSSALHQLPASARHLVAAAALLRKGYQSFINCSSRFD